MLHCKGRIDFVDIYTFLNDEKEKNFILDLSLAKKSHVGKRLLCNAHIYEEGFLINANNIATYVEANRTVSISRLSCLNHTGTEKV